MSSLQIGLAVAGGLVLAGLVAHSTWQARKHAVRQAQTPRQEPGLGPDFFAAPADAEGAAAPAEPDPDLALLGRPVAAERKPGLDALIDVLALLTPAEAVHSAAALAALPPTRRVGSKPFAIEGQNLESGQWEPIQPGLRYQAFQAGVQLANRMGALNEIEFSEFVVKTQAFADAVNADAEFPDMREAVARARELDQFASSHDAQLGFTLRAARAAWSPGFVQQHAASWGFVPGVLPGRLVLPASEAGLPPVLVLQYDAQAALADNPAHSAVHSLSLSLDVPQVQRSEQPFARMRELAAALAQAMDGVLTDDNGQPLQTVALDGIAQDLEQLYDTLDARDLCAGSPQSRRLFS